MIHTAKSLLTEAPSVVNIGLDSFRQALSDKNIPAQQLDWKPAAAGDTMLVDLLFQCQLHADEINAANKEAADRIMKGQPVLVAVRPAGEVVPGSKPYHIFHAGPPVAYDDMCGPMQGAVVGAIVYEGWAENFDEAEELIHAGKIVFDCNHHHSAVGPMTGIITPSMPVFVVENSVYGNRAFCTINEGLGEVMRFGANGPNVLKKLKWLEEVLGPVLDETVKRIGGVNLKNIMAQALAMGDEMHQRNTAASLNFYKTICAELTEVINGRDDAETIVSFLVKGNDQFFLNLAMASGKCLTDPARNIPKSTVVTCMSRNGVDFGINVSSLGSQWFTAPVKMPVGMFFPGYSEEDANPDMGDSAITECIGIGGFAMGCSPAVVNFIGAGSVSAALDYSYQMQEITTAPNPNLPMPNLNFLGVATGIDIQKVVETGILPVINTGMAHKKAGIGQVGAGIATPPIEIFQEALKVFVETQLK